MCAYHGQTAKRSLVQDTDVEGWGIQLLFRQVLGSGDTEGTLVTSVSYV